MRILPLHEEGTSLSYTDSPQLIGYPYEGTVRGKEDEESTIRDPRQILDHSTSNPSEGEPLYTTRQRDIIRNHDDDLRLIVKGRGLHHLPDPEPFTPEPDAVTEAPDAIP